MAENEGEDRVSVVGRTPRLGLLKDGDLSPEELLELVALAIYLKAARRSGQESPRLNGKTVSLIFDRPSTRTRSAFEVAAAHQGAWVTYLDPTTLHLGSLESAEDTARVLGRFYDGIAYRGKEHAILETFARHAGVPVWNALSDEWHPTQGIADMVTVREHSEKPWSEITLAFVGDGSANVANSLSVCGALLGMNIRIVSPLELRSTSTIDALVNQICNSTGGNVIRTADMDEGVRGVDFIYTDSWIRIGEPVHEWRERITALLPFRIDRRVMERTNNRQVRFMHCLPATHGCETACGREFKRETGQTSAEVTDDVFESPQSIVFEQAENRMHAIKALITADLAE